MAKARFFKVENGKHHHRYPDGREAFLKQGALIRDDTGVDLAKKWPGKLVEVPEPEGWKGNARSLEAAANTTPTKQLPGENPSVPELGTGPSDDAADKAVEGDLTTDADGNPPEEEKKTKAPKVLGEDETNKFPLAVDGDYKVFKAKKGNKVGYFVTTAADQQTSLTDKPLKSVAEVNAWLEAQDEEEDEDEA